ncbi:MAG: hypothetical protein Q8M15_10645 [Bacteroidota bacterium]|nr:hypothetical protein [Bacteroidota bacterium]
MFHEIIPHYHPEGDALKVSILTGKDEKSNEEKSDENGILDNLEIVLSKPQSTLNPFFTYLSNYLSNGLADINFFYFPDLIAYLKYFSTKSPPNYLSVYKVSHLRAPPSLL